MKDNHPQRRGRMRQESPWSSVLVKFGSHIADAYCCINLHGVFFVRWKNMCLVRCVALLVAVDL